MTTHINRRSFIAASAAGALAVNGVVNAAEKKREIKKTLKIGMLPGQDKDKKPLSVYERLKVAKDAGFDGVEPDTIFDEKQLDATIEAAQKLEIELDAIICSKHWSHPLSDPNPAVYEECINGMKVSIQNAKKMGGDMVLLVPAVVTPKVMYRDAWKNSMTHLKELAKYAEDMGIVIGLENVWNKFLLSPIEFREYVEEADSPFVRAWFDVGNVVQFGFPQDWIRTLSDTIARIDIKDFKAEWGKYEFCKLKEGNVDWKEVMTAFDEIGYTKGWFAAEVSGGDLDYLSEYVAKPMDEFISL